jgi:hypothetical protein
VLLRGLVLLCSLARTLTADNSGLVSLTEVTEMLHDFYPDIELPVIIRAFKAADRSQVTKRSCFSHLYIKTNILPRQARDKHRENSKKEAVLLQAGKLNKSSFRKLFEYLIFFNNVAHLFERIDDSG